MNRLAEILRRNFYIGLFELRGETYAGLHEPLISKRLFDQVQGMLDGKLYARPVQHDFLYRRMVRCTCCGYHLIGERQKGHVYYRCHTKGCRTTSVRETRLEEVVTGLLEKVSFEDKEAAALMDIAGRNEAAAVKAMDAARQSREFRIKQIDLRLSRLTDAFLDGAVDQTLFQEKKRDLLDEQLRLREELDRANSATQHEQVVNFLELVTGLQQSYILAETEEKRGILKSTTSNLAVAGKNVEIALFSPYQEIAMLHSVRSSVLERGRPRTFMKTIYEILSQYFAA
ncbi:recombinase zinc beta ribbon domain-containing protein [Emcibacter sp. SYSU 3D8]|uniref:recombinase zinc beta ribbon domain-containing protein n=1 Tax=Emcibacter sp. SYSU 3D8 TaxID=3133969 RepID=UPI0031FF3117